MNEMLGNQYFLTRRFKDATFNFEIALSQNPLNNDVKKKLIVCYIQQNKTKLALQLFTELISKNIEVILSSDPIKDDCPCKNLICEIENTDLNLNSTEKCEMLGMLCLYCDIVKSRQYFNKLISINPESYHYQAIVKRINQPFSTN
jgi:tetratricopeptide (TPR) repeat protein